MPGSIPEGRPVFSYISRIEIQIQALLEDPIPFSGKSHISLTRSDLCESATLSQHPYLYDFTTLNTPAMAYALPQDTGVLTPAEQKILRANGILNKLSQSKWEAFAAWANEHEPSVPLAQQWLSQHDVDSDASFLCTLLLMKVAGGAQQKSKAKEAGKLL